jgi:hypothetical protein
MQVPPLAHGDCKHGDAVVVVLVVVVVVVEVVVVIMVVIGAAVVVVVVICWQYLYKRRHYILYMRKYSLIKVYTVQYMVDNMNKRIDFD